MSSEVLILFTNRFPYFGGETFLETEIIYLSEAFKKITICPKEKGQEYYGPLPFNVEVLNVEDSGNLRIRDILKSYGMLIGKYYILAFFRSRHRYKYISQFKFTWNTLMGFIRRGEWLRGQFQDKAKTSAVNTVYYSYWFNEWASALALAKSKGLMGRYAVRAHGYDYDEQQNGRGYFPFRESEMTQFDKMVQISEYGLLKMRKQYPQAKNLMLQKLGVVDNGLNPVAEEGAKYRIVSCSNFVKLKRLPLMIDILSTLELDFEWVHFGWGEGADDIVKLAGQKLKPGSFEFRGLTPNDGVLRYYRENRVDLVINVSELEGIPVSLMEAIASGIPVAGCNVCGVPELVCDETGILLPVNPEPEITAALLKQFLIERSRNAEFRQGIKTFWSAHFNAEKNYKMFIERALN